MPNHETARPILGLLAFFMIAELTSAPGSSQGPGQPWKNKSLSPDDRTDLLVKQLTLDEKIQLVHGGIGYDAGGWKRMPGSQGDDGFVPGIPRLGIPDLRLIGAGRNKFRSTAEWSIDGFAFSTC